MCYLKHAENKWFKLLKKIKFVLGEIIKVNGTYADDGQNQLITENSFEVCNQSTFSRHSCFPRVYCLTMLAQ